MANRKTREQLSDRADTLNRNKGTNGQNMKNAKANGNHSKQLQENRSTGK
ncbi:hypothetical protein MHM84_20330 [Halomonas sp. McH1-25]|nr:MULTISPECIES: hypothetical protein [unclassified Halomonas]MCG7602092.1 hypothetical protein [Halomonas sp. McH1-25]MCP1343008.1 hypothetical protein [Halomonas sp. FL8]MCP1362536.1 hypothetical protein [Halomonas sp. BBD45]MCP1364315.1 hypothetical protein [Halomonas sp. BBD48]